MTTLLLTEYEKPADLAYYHAGLSSPGLTVLTAASEAEALAQAPQADILVGKAQTVTPALFRAAPKVRWIQALTTGTDPIDALPPPPYLTVTSMRGIHGPQMSELAILLMLALQRDFPRMLENGKNHVWQRWPQRLLAGRNALIVGVGQISETLAQRCAAFGMTVEGISDGRREAPGFTALYPRAELPHAAARADFVLVVVPYSPATHDLIGETVLRAMKPDAYLVNIARGKIVNETALRRALDEKWIAGAALDVFEREPLPAEDPLWGAPNLIITPHIGGMSDRYAEQALPVVKRNLEAYLGGKLDDMINIVKRGE
jgi:phosphoglycerate dehydrogenase-like enzyme